MLQNDRIQRNYSRGTKTAERDGEQKFSLNIIYYNIRHWHTKM